MEQILKQIRDLLKRVARLETMETAPVSYGPAFPTENLFDGRRFYRTDRDIEYYYDLANTRWLSAQLLTLTIGGERAQTYAAGNAYFYVGLPGRSIGNGVLLETMEIMFFPVSTNQDVANYYNLTGIVFGTVTNAGTINNINTQGLTAGSYRNLIWDINEAFDNTYYAFQSRLAIGAGSPGTYQWGAALSYRLIG